MSLYADLHQSSVILSSFCLYKSAKWSAEALNGLPEPDQPINTGLPDATPQELKDSYKLLLAKTYFDCKEFDRITDLLKNCQSGKALFFRLYALYISSELKLQQQYQEILTDKQLNYKNDKLPGIVREIEKYLDLKPQDNNMILSFIYYLGGIVYLKLNDHKHAQTYLVQSVSLYQYNWECWNDLLSCFHSFDDALVVISELKPSDSFMVRTFTVVAHQEFFQQNMALNSQLDLLIEIFPYFSFFKAQKALIAYQSLNYPVAESLFDDLLLSDPYSLDHLDIYSNILYVMENKAKLSFLAQFANSIDKFRPETCCIIANYYSLKFEHEKAIMYYKRALNLNKNCLSAWTLMGHEFVELKNSHAAIESYRRAVDINHKDFRAWYGLGQAYEVLDMYLYSLYYYQKSCELKPLDKRMWVAIGNCYEKLGKTTESIKSYKKVLNLDDEDLTFVLRKLGKLYESIRDWHNAEYYMKLCYNEEINTEIITEDSGKARLWLAKRDLFKGNYHSAYKYASEFNNGSSQEIEEARSIVRECRNRMK